ncbi:tetratricopeptide repeat protein [Marinicella sp. S1101]|uniref:tetratricopeptide repeat protein n=1 Tax=Marinicella marina TaxID=2996016 RepID=UPI002260B7FC|nr:tetratricopeptide repeat protein [Marinicella marina]MCX7552363.1 tetratricopeptide repeat protein [Marinicella marina]MDJ1139238.1 tetratricopeptide repeat protein [Marinicella marina]
MSLSLCLSVAAQQQSDCWQKDQDTDVLALCLQAYDSAAYSANNHGAIEVGFRVADLYQQQGEFARSNEFLLSMSQQFPDLTNQFLIRHQLLRDMGINHYYLKDYSQALQIFQQAFDIADVQQDLLALSKSYNDLGVVYKAQSRFADSLSAYQQSLKIKETLGIDLEIAKSLNNIANVLLLMGKYESAITYHRRSLALFEQFDQQDFDGREQVIHIKDQIALALSRIGKVDEAIEILEQSIQQTSEWPAHELLLFETHCNLAKIYLLNGQVAAAYDAINKTQDISGMRSDQVLLRHEVYAAVHRAQNDFFQAEREALAGLNLAQLNKDQEQISLFFKMLSDINQAQGDDAAALNYLRQFIASHENNLKQNYDTGIKYLQNEIELQVQQKNLSLLQKNNEIQELQIRNQQWLVFSVLLLAAISALLVWWYFKKKAAEKQQLLNQITYHRKQLDELKTPKQRLESFFKNIKEPMVCVDQTYRITHLNSAFCQFFKLQMDSSLQMHLPTLLPVFEVAINGITFNQDELPKQQFVPVQISQTKQVLMWINVMSHMDNTIVLSLQLEQHQQPLPTDSFNLVANSNQINAIVAKLNVLKNTNNILTKDLILQIDQKLKLADSGVDDLSQAYRTSMVELMTSNLEVWRKNTQGDRITLAEKSAVWKVTIDDGRLRTRAMDRYLSLKTLPKTPRWRSVVKTSHYILAECQLSFEQRKYLNDRLEVFMVNLKAYTSGI